jgi:hypothetical protein
MPHKEWRFEEVPDSFWQRIEAARGDPERFRASLADMSRDELKEMYTQYTELAEQLFTEAHLARLGPEATEDTAMDLANWVVMQGKDFYKKVHSDPKKTPRRRQLHGPSFASMMVREFRKRFGEAIV